MKLEERTKLRILQVLHREMSTASHGELERALREVAKHTSFNKHLKTLLNCGLVRSRLSSSALEIPTHIYTITNTGIAELSKLEVIIEKKAVDRSIPQDIETVFQKWRQMTKDETTRILLMQNLLIDLLAYFRTKYPISQLATLARNYWKDGRFSKPPGIRKFQAILDNWKQSGEFEVDEEGFVVPSSKFMRRIRNEGQNIVYYIAFANVD